MSLYIDQLAVLGDNYCYLLRDDTRGQTAVIDPGEASTIIKRLNQNGWKLDYILNTHHHHDHVGGNLELKKNYKCQVVGPAKEQRMIPGIDILLKDNDRFMLGDHSLQIIETPGHTEGHVCYYVVENHRLFSGDHLFSLGCGRLFGGTAAQMWESLMKIRSLPKDTLVYCAHEYTNQNARFALTVEPNNVTLQQRFEEVTRLRAESKSTIPSELKSELSANPFLRPESPEIRESINKKGASNLEVFTTLRRMKDRF